MTDATPIITSASHPLIKRARRLKQRKYRSTEQCFLLEGIRPFIEAVESGARIETILASPDLLTSAHAYAAIAAARTAGARYYILSPAAFAALSDRDNPVGLAAIVHYPQWTINDLPRTPTSFYVALEEVHDPGNLGTILRTLDGAGASGVFLIGHTTDPYHPTAVRASMGALFTVPLIAMPEIAAVLSWCRQNGIMTIATTPTAAFPFWEAEYHLPALLFMGSEAQGLSDEALHACDLAVRIPMFGKADSLNLAVATALLAYELRRQICTGGQPAR
jgi:TrmH family RNA methyltransferase